MLHELLFPGILKSIELYKINGVEKIEKTISSESWLPMQENLDLIKKALGKSYFHFFIFLQILLLNFT